MRKAGLLAVALILSVLSLPMATPSPDPVVIAIIDTGIRPTHEAFQNGQIVAWYDFSNDSPRSNATTWDPLVSVPYDPVGHGTGVASMAAGDLGSYTRSFGPDLSLAIARFDEDYFVDDVTQAIYWATDVVGADVISITSGFGIPFPTLPGPIAASADAIQHARASGVLVVMAAGNGLMGQPVPDLSWPRPPAHYDALVVGGAVGEEDDVFYCEDEVNQMIDCVPLKRVKGQPRGSTKDPEVTSDYDAWTACANSDDCYLLQSGTSFAAPRVASLAAKLVEYARAEGKPLTVDELEWTIKKVATPHSLTESDYRVKRDAGEVGGGPCTTVAFVTVCPPQARETPPVDVTVGPGLAPVHPPAPTQEGYGYIDDDALEKGKALIDGAPGPSGADWEFRVWYVETYRDRMQRVFNDDIRALL